MLQEITDKVLRRVAESAKVAVTDVTLGSSLAALGLDSIGIVEIVLDLEEDLDSDIDSDYDDGTIETVGQLVDFVASSVRARAAGRSAS